jgi:hypothetical protein
MSEHSDSINISEAAIILAGIAADSARAPYARRMAAQKLAGLLCAFEDLHDLNTGAQEGLEES